MTPDEIKSRLKEKKLTQSQVAERMGKSITTVNFLIHGRFKNNELEKSFARVLGVSLKKLLEQPEVLVVGK